MPVSDFSAQMAQMIAQARLPQAPTGGGRSRIMGGAGGMGIMGKESQVSAAVDVGPWMRLFGYKSPEEKEKAVQGLQIKKEQADPDQWETWESSETGQTVLKSLGKTAGTFQDVGGRWKVMTRTPEAMIRAGKPAEEQVFTGAYGVPAREKALEARKEIVEAGKAFDPEKLMATGTPEEINKYLTNKVISTEKLAVAAETPTHRQALEAQRDQAKKGLELFNLQVQTEQEKINFTPQQRVMDKETHDKTMAKLTQETRTLRQHGDLAAAQAKQIGLASKGDLEDLRDNRNLYRQSRVLFDKAWADTVGGTSIRKDQTLGLLTGMTHSHLMGVGSVSRKEIKTKEGIKRVPDLREGNESFGYWLSRVGDEFEVSKKGIVGREQRPGVLGIYGEITGQRVVPEEDVRWQRYAGQLTDFLKIISYDTYPLYKVKAIDLFTDIYTKTAPTSRMNQLAEDMVMLGEAFGVSVDVLQEEILKRKTRPTKPEIPLGGITETGAP